MHSEYQLQPTTRSPKKKQDAEKLLQEAKSSLAKDEDRSKRNDSQKSEAKELLPGEIPVHFATKAFTCIVVDRLVSFKQFDVIKDQYSLYHMLKIKDLPIQVFEGDLIKCPKCSNVFASSKHVVSE